MTDYKLTEEVFLKEIENHKMHVIRDDGVHRHLRFNPPGSYMMGFDIITWPGSLCYTGDMGTYVFERVEDMFKFFGDDGEGCLGINPRYWSEKVQAACRDGVTEYSADKFREVVAQQLDSMEADQETRELVESEVLPCADEGEAYARRAAYDASINGENVFYDFWENDLHVFTHRYRWCCYALVWAIRVYDQLEKNNA